MALVIKCRSCRKRVPEDSATCPACGSSDLRFIVDWWPNGRNGGRKQFTLPDTVQDATEARGLERLWMSGSSKKRSRHDEQKIKTVADLFPDYLMWFRNHRAATTLKDLSWAWEATIKKILGDYQIRSITSEHFSLYQRVRSKTVKARTINKELDYFSGFLRWCRREKKIPLEKIEYEKLPSNRPLPIVLSPEEIARIIAAAEKHPVYHALILCLYTLGLRSNEARWLTWDDIDIENKCLRVRQKRGTWKILPVNDQVLGALDRVKEWQEKKGRPGKYVFSVRKSGQPVGNFRKALATICEDADITKKVTPHLFRHSIATHLMGADVNMRTIQQYLGHSQISTTQFYTHVAMEHLRAAQACLYKKS